MAADNSQRVNVLAGILKKDRSMPVDIPDFTAGAWQTNKPLMDITPECFQPFFLYWATPIPHVPLQAPREWVDYYVK